MINAQLKALLTPIRAMVEKMLPAYRFFQGRTTETKTVELLEGTICANGSDIIALTLLDPTFRDFVAGQTYTVTVDGVSGKYVAFKDMDANVIAKNYDADTGDCDWLVYKENNDFLVYTTNSTYDNATIKVSQTRTVTTDHWRVKKLHNDLLPDWVGKQLDAVEKAVNQAKSVAESKMSANNPTGTGAFSMGRKANTTVGMNSHAEGYNTTASGESSHAEGYNTTASRNNSHAEGYYTKASSENQHVQGKYNIEDTANKYAHIVGNGTRNSARSNAHTLDWNGNAWFKGNVYVGGANQEAGAKLATVAEVEDMLDGSTPSAGSDGGYYTPSVDSSGNLTWTASKTGMAAVASVNIKGSKGDTGATGPAGTAGTNGTTPVKGTDYFTAADKAELVEDVLDALPTWTGGSY